jgi:hypothetical protein
MTAIFTVFTISNPPYGTLRIFGYAYIIKDKTVRVNRKRVQKTLLLEQKQAKNAKKIHILEKELESFKR